MSHFTHSYSEFRVSSLGKYENYILFFHHGDNLTRQFGSILGINSVAIESNDPEIEFAMWLVEHKPSWLNSHVFINSTTILLFTNKSSVKEFQKRFISYSNHESKQISPFGIKDSLILSIPRGLGWSNKNATNLHDLILNGIAAKIKRGWGTREVKNKLDKVASDLSKDFGLDVYGFDNVIVFDTTEHAIKIFPEVQKEYLQNILREIKDLKSIICQLEQTSKSNEILKQLNEVRKTIAESADTGKPLSVQASVGFDFFGNGIKLTYDTSKLPINKIENIKEQIDNFLKDKITPRKRLKMEDSIKNAT